MLVDLNICARISTRTREKKKSKDLYMNTPAETV